MGVVSMSRFAKVLIVIAVALLAAGCGARGPLEPPPGSQHDPNADPPFILDPVVGQTE